MATLIERLIAAGVDGLLILGSSGEFCHMSTEMRLEVAAFAGRQVAGRLPLLIGAGACATSEVIAFSRHAAEHGADGVLAVNPYYARISEEGLFQHYHAIAEAVPVPVMLYNFPALTGQELPVPLIRRLALACPNIVGLKDTVDCISHTRQAIVDVKGVRPDFMVFAGFDEYLLDTLILGGDGAIPGTANFAPEICLGIVKAWRARDLDAITALSGKLARLMPIYGLDTPFFGLVKEAVRLTGCDISPAVLAPGRMPDARTRQLLIETLKAAGVPIAQDACRAAQ